MCVRRLCAVLATLAALPEHVIADFEYMVTTPESIVVDINYATALVCEMNIEPDKFEWKFYPSNEPYNSKTDINLSSAKFGLLPKDNFKVHKRKSILEVHVNNTDVVGDYQCLAYYGASVVASVPWRISIEKLEKFAGQKNVSLSVQSGNTVSWRCAAPESNPDAYIDYMKGETYISPIPVDKHSGSMILPNVAVEDSGNYRCVATNIFKKETSDAVFKLEVVRNGLPKPPSFIVEPKKEYTILSGSSVFLACSAVGNPIPKVVWFKKQSELPSSRIELITGGIIIKNITSTDDGIYVCNHTNIYGTVSHQITVRYNEDPSVDCLMNTTDVKQGENLDLECIVTGTPDPQLTWFLNGFSVGNDSAIEAVGNRIYFRPIEKRHAGNLQLFARNSVKTVYDSTSIRVIPLATSIDMPMPPSRPHQRHHRKPQGTKKPSKHNKTPKLVPPNKPTITRLNDETVVVRWNVPSNDGLPIQFFKVQYKEIGPANPRHGHSQSKEWKTTNIDIPPNIKAYDVFGLKSDHIYKFRIAAVYSNNDYKLSPVSNKFHLKRLDFDERNPLPICWITHTETANSTAIKVYWQCPPYNVTVDGFYLSYMSATRAGDDYMKTTVDGDGTRNFVITHLHPETSYDIKLQSFNSKLASEFSQLMKGRTGLNPVSSHTTTQFSTTKTTPTPEASSTSNVYVISVGTIIAAALVIASLILLFVCRKWKQKKLTDTEDKPSVEHHIQADGTDYVVEAKSLPRSNGCAIPSNRITITPNPLADAETKPTLDRVFSRIRRP
ncbi:interference hedgehog-like isoform X2 [Cylas formicarius]|uniref:interference hedgehog-like isoform X2 n=1 Tax=Cylas formicarius TaxID=197179 RepID=UPI002958DD44|nr:interference hedgehog-like isoform X2 [Cylas formicarius]